jgi:hypothetical protein
MTAISEVAWCLGSGNVKSPATVQAALLSYSKPMRINVVQNGSGSLDNLITNNAPHHVHDFEFIEWLDQDLTL